MRSRAKGFASVAIAALFAGSVLVACGSAGVVGGAAQAEDGSTGSPSAPSASPSGRSYTLVALGGSIPYAGPNCDNCVSFVDVFADDMTKDTGLPVTVHNWTIPGSTSADLLDALRANALVRQAVTGADIVTVTIGHNDTPWNVANDPCDGEREYPDAQWTAYAEPCVATWAAEYGRNLDAILAEIRTLRDGASTMVRVTNDYNDIIGDPTASAGADGPTRTVLDASTRTACAAARRAGALCADVYHAFNGPKGTRDAGPLLASDHTHPSQSGQDLIAELLRRLGYEPLAP
jgi:lysophospholipase L1-like esterase